MKKQEARDCLKRALSKIQKKTIVKAEEKEEKPISPEEKQYLMRQDQLIKIQDNAKAKIDQKWQSNPFKTFR